MIPFFIDAHEDIAWNWFEAQRDPLEDIATARQREAGSHIEAALGKRMTALPQWLAGRVAVVFATIYVMPKRVARRARHTYETPEEAHRRGRMQLAFYQSLAARTPQVRLIESTNDLHAVLHTWRTPNALRRVGLLVSLEGADAIRTPEEVADWYSRGLRAIGLAWGRTRYAGGTHEPGPLTDLGRALLREMHAFQMLLDLSHAAEEAFWQALDAYDGPIIASHSNPRAFCNTDRHLSDEMIRALAERDGVMGIVPYNAFLLDNWRETRAPVPLDRVADAIDHVVQLLGTPRHVAIGTDFDGGFGADATPEGLDSIADLERIFDVLQARGYDEEALHAIAYGNWVRMLERTLPTW